jgi:hypothetical protein
MEGSEIRDRCSRIPLPAMRATIINHPAAIGKNLSLVRASRLR